MCGIAGIVRFDGGGIARGVLEGMGRALVHRGPDGSGVWEAPGVGLVHRRLSILDLSEAGAQPMSNEDGTVWITYNGEVYNFVELRAELIEKGHVFRSGTDTEVLVHLYEEEGPALVERLRGMFSFALWDVRRERLVLGRDRLGQKPLYYHLTDGRLAFASEMTGLLADPEVPREVDRVRIDDFLTYQYVPSPHSALKGVRKLPPGHIAVFDAKGFETSRYWSLSFEPKTDLTWQDACARLREILDEAVRLRMIADVPLGAFLSGGIDSSAVVAAMARNSDRPVKTFSIGFEDQDFSEVAYARLIAERYSTDHQELIIRPQAWEILPRLARHYGDPYADSSAIPTYYVSQVTREHVTVALNGDGGDEAFGGYERYRAQRWMALGRWIPSAIRRGMIGGLGLMGESTDRAPLLRRIKRFLEFSGRSGDDSYFRMLTIFDAEDRHRLYTPDMRELVGARDPWDYFRKALGFSDAKDPVDRMLAVDVATYLPEDLLAKVDIASMAHSLEARSPFLDHVLVEFAARLPGSFKIQGPTFKRILKEVLEGDLPASIRKRPKMGFGIPVGRWYRRELKEQVREVLLDPRSLERGYFDPTALEDLLDEHVDGIRDHGYRLHALLMLELWHREVLEAAEA